MNEDLPKQNTGLIEGRRDTDWLAGTIPYVERNKSGDWRPYLVTEEHQYSHNTDTMACVSFSHNNDLEIQTKFLTGKEVNYSDRFLAKMSGTTHDGNWQWKVADTARLTGLVPEEVWPANGDYTWDSYYAPIPQEVINKAQKPNIQYEWVGIDEASLKYHLKQAPIQITLPAPYPNHAVVLVHVENGVAYYFDTYPPYLKTIAVNKISSALKIVLTMNQFPMKKVKINGAYGIMLDTPNTTIITKAEDEAEWRSYSKADSYQAHTVNQDGSTDWSVDLEIKY